jgi:hypothetical protein
MTFIIKQNDTRPAYVAVLKEDFGLETEAPVDLTDAESVRFLARTTDNTEVLNVDGSADIDDAVNGIISYTWAEGDTATVGEYQIEIEVTWDDGGVETFPNNGYASMTVVDDLDI